MPHPLNKGEQSFKYGTSNQPDIVHFSMYRYFGNTAERKNFFYITITSILAYPYGLLQRKGTVLSIPFSRLLTFRLRYICAVCTVMVSSRPGEVGLYSNVQILSPLLTAFMYMCHYLKKVTVGIV